MPDASLERETDSGECWRWLEVENFRGFHRPARFDLSASALIVHGPNGTGKTSFFDALQWLLIGDLPRLRSLRMRQTEEYIKNAYASGPARIGAELMLQGKLVKVERIGDRAGSDLLMQIDGMVLDGSAAEAQLEQLLTTGTGSSLKEALFSSALLQQDDLRYVLTASPADRFEQLSQLLGLGALERFETDAVQSAKVSNASKTTARQAAEQADARLSLLRRELEGIKDDEGKLPAAETLLSGLANDITTLGATGLAIEIPLTPGDVPTLSKATRLLENRLRSLLEAVQSTEVLPAELPGGSLESLTVERERQAVSLSSAAEELTARRGEVASLERVLAAARRDSDAFSQMVSLATPLLGDTCPVCEQRIVAEDVRESLVRRAAQATALTTVQQELASSLTSRDAAEESVESTADALATTDARLSTAAQWRLARSKAADEWRQLVDSRLLLSPASPEDVVTPTRQWITEALQTLSALRRSVDATAAALAALTRGSRLNAMVEEVELAEQRADSAKSGWEAAARAASQADALAKASTRARLQVINRRVAALQPLADDVFSRLDPHPTFQRLQFESEVFRNKGTMSTRVEDEATGVSVSPSLAFSSAQANMTALTYFLALALGMGDRAMPFICLDDPLQDMDDVNVLAFTDLARHLREDRQLILATHERRFAALLRRKLAPRNVDERLRLITFTGWSRDGPEFHEELVERPTAELRLLA